MIKTRTILGEKFYMVEFGDEEIVLSYAPLLRKAADWLDKAKLGKDPTLHSLLLLEDYPGEKRLEIIYSLLSGDQ